MKVLSYEARKQHMEKCNSCPHRKLAATRFDMHFDWLDCWYNCPNDYEHWLAETDNKEKEN